MFHVPVFQVKTHPSVYTLNMILYVIYMAILRKKEEIRMEHWNKNFSEIQKQAEEEAEAIAAENGKIVQKEQAEIWQKDEKIVYTMQEIYKEIYDETFVDPDDSKPKVNKLFHALFGCKVKDILIKKGRGYVIGENGKRLIKFLVKICATEDGRKIIRGKYNEIDFQIENILLYYVSDFLNEWDMQEGEKRKTVDGLCREIMAKFNIGKGTFELRKSIADFNMWMETLVNDDESVFIHGNAAEVLRKWVCSQKKKQKMAREIDEFAGHMFDYM